MKEEMMNRVMMVHLKLFEAYFDSDGVYEEVSYQKLNEFMSSHTNIENYKYEQELEMIDKLFNLYQRDVDDFNNNQYDVTHNYQNSYHDSSLLEIYLVRKKIDIFISAYDDEWYTIRYCEYRRYDDLDYSKQLYYICDGLDGLNQWFKTIT